MIIHRVKIKNGLLGDFYPSKMPESRGTIIFLAGLPSYQHKNQFGEKLSLAGFHVLQPFYYGSWVSAGEFSVENCFKTVNDSVSTIIRGKLFDLYTRQYIMLGRNPVYLGGISFGTSVIQSLPTPANIQKIFLISAVPLFKEPYLKQMKFDGAELVRFLKNGFPGAYRAREWQCWVREFSGKGRFLHRFAAQAPLRIYQGERDSISPSTVKQYLQEEQLKIPLLIIKNAGHALNEFNQEHLAMLVGRYLTSI